MTTIDTGDSVRHKPSEEEWLVAYAEGGHVVPCGWPQTIAAEADCVLIRKASDAERLQLLRKMADMSDATDRRCRHARLALGSCVRCGGEMKTGQALEQTFSGFPDFPGGDLVTLTPSGPGRLVDCLKCERCGWSITK